MTEYEQFINRKRREFGAQFDASELAPQFVPYFDGKRTRIEVKFSYGEVRRGYVGVTTGWRPCFLLMARSDSIGSSNTLGAEDTVLRVIRRAA